MPSQADRQKVLEHADKLQGNPNFREVISYCKNELQSKLEQLPLQEPGDATESLKAECRALKQYIKIFSGNL